MKTKLLTMIALLTITSTQVQARPSLSQMDQKLDALLVCSPGTPTRFVDNGDGTICDSETGLMWEMKNGSDGVPNFNNPRDVDNLYPLVAGAAAFVFPRTAFTDFLPRLNGEVASNSASGQLGRYSDWRLPTSAELQTIRNCSFNPCINPIFGPTISPFPYWTSTTRTDIAGIMPSDAWAVTFSENVPGGMPIAGKHLPLHVRAVRGGR